ncbi:MULTISPECIES: alpha/beta hydrolase [unclassified Aureispira]|uniref:alpha/beta hydrolase n=1 Tax=unclassified Aureispira TaxID=2649989 RepID=UPI000697318C|nr:MULTISPECIES: alpha/beta hydrolase [unclassified Aureispira]WMX17424.1 alpha/beta hydrolase [Aureispira sp. CCB-E]
MKKLVFFLLIISIVLVGCRLDNFLYNPTQIEEYKFDAFDEEQKFVLGASYAIPDHLVHLMTLESGPVDDRETIYATYIGDISRINQDTIILYCHGNAGHMDYYWQRAKLLANAGGKNRFGVLFMDYRGYGKSTGKATEAGLYYDVDACMRWLKDKGLTNDRLVIYGFSMGGAPSTELTANPRTMVPSKLILEAPFASFDFMVQDIAKVSFPGSFYGNLEIDNSVEIQKVQAPFLWIHGIDDAFVGIHHGELIQQNYNGTHKVIRRVPGGEHSTVPMVMGFDIYTKLIADFITEKI